MRILVIKLSSLGDLFHPLPAVHILKQELAASIDWVTTDSYTELVDCFTDVDRAIPFYRRRFMPNPSAFLRRLRAQQYDLIVDFQGLLKSALVARLARGRRTIGPSFHREGSRLFYSSVAGPRDAGRHAVDQNLDIVRCLGLPCSPPVFPLDIPRRGMTGAAPRVALLPVSRWATKNWPTRHWTTLIERLRSAGISSLVLLGSKEDRSVCREIDRRAGGGTENLAGRLSLVETAGVLREVDLLISNDSGPVHMAAALGTPCLVLFGPTDPTRTGPYGAGHRVLARDLDCMPCLSRTCRIGTQACLEGIEAREVADAALAQLKDRLDAGCAVRV